jgi:hypothetical protein
MDLWVDNRLIGYVALDEAGNPVIPTGQLFGKNVNKPPRIYQTLRMALKQSPCESASEVRMFTVESNING